MDGQPRVRNVKVSIRLDIKEQFELLKKKAYKYTNSYLILKEGGYTITVYHNSNVVNITGIPNFEQIDLALQYFSILTAIPYYLLVLTVKVDNSTANGQLRQKVDFNLLRQSNCVITYNPSLFPGATLTLSNLKKAILFKSGKYVLVGCKSEDEITESFSSLQTITKQVLGRQHEL
jgi:TATA-box binding protein (TBP) (component of TFIID and TFIIIB)